MEVSWFAHTFPGCQNKSRIGRHGLNLLGLHSLIPTLKAWRSHTHAMYWTLNIFFRGSSPASYYESWAETGNEAIVSRAGLSHTLRVWLRENNVVRPNQKNAAILVLYSEQVVLFNWSSTCVT